MIITKGEAMYDLIKKKAEILTAEEFKKWWLRSDIQRQVRIFSDSREKERRINLKTFILRRWAQANKGKGPDWEYKKVKWADISYFYTNAKVGRDVNLYGSTREVWKIFKILNKKKRPGKRPKGAVFSEFAAPFVIPDYMKILESIGKPGRIIFSHSRPGKNFMFNEYMRDHLLRVARCKERSILIHLIDEREKLKEFHKRPYFKVVVEEVKGKPLGVEEYDKILFPCWCSYKIYGQVYTGQLNCGYHKGAYLYKLYKVVDQTRGSNLVDSSGSINYLVNEYKIEILKGELKLWREVVKKGESKNKEQ